VTALVARKWRPSLQLLTFAAISVMIALPLVGLAVARLDENQLVRQTEESLIAQAAMLSAIYVLEAGALEEGPIPLGARRPRARIEVSKHPDYPWTPVEPALDLGVTPIRPPRPEPRDGPFKPPAPASLALGTRLFEVTNATQRVTLAGFIILDAHGAIIAGREGAGRSLAHVEEVQEALAGRYASALRRRGEEWAPVPLASISRGTGVRVFVAMPVFIDDRVAGVVYLSRTPSNVLRHLYEERGKVVLLALLLAAAAGLVGAAFVRTIARPIRRLIERSEEIAAGAPDAIRPLTHHGTRELAALTESFLAMAAKLSERSAYVTTLAAHVSHELKSPLTSIKGAAELLRESGEAMSGEDRDRFHRNIIEDAARLSLLVERLRDLARADNPRLGGATTMAAVAGDLAASFPSLAVTTEGDMDALVRMSRENAAIVLSHLLDNATKHGATAVAIAARENGDRLTVTVSDDGPGISEANREKVFDPFFTTRRESGGTGMGLGIARAMLRAHGGDMSLLQSKEGASFLLELPAEARNPARGKADGAQLDSNVDGLSSPSPLVGEGTGERGPSAWARLFFDWRLRRRPSPLSPPPQGGRGTLAAVVAGMARGRRRRGDA
jgi:signal transduction histidine kinase